MRKMRWVAVGIVLDACGSAAVALAWPPNALGLVGMVALYALMIYAVHAYALPRAIAGRVAPKKAALGFAILYSLCVVVLALPFAIMAGVVMFLIEVAGRIGQDLTWVMVAGVSCVAGMFAGLMLHAFRPDRAAGGPGAPWRARSDLAGGVMAALVIASYPWPPALLAADFPPLTIKRWAGLVVLSVAALVPHLVLSAWDASRLPILSSAWAGKRAV